VRRAGSGRWQVVAADGSAAGAKAKGERQDAKDAKTGGEDNEKALATDEHR
jgi:hypothetical protein